MEVHTSELQKRIEAAHGHTLAELKQQAEAAPQDAGMLGALLTVHDDLRFAEYTVGFQLQRLRQLVDPERQGGDFDVSHMADCIQRLAQAHSARKAHTAALTALLDATRPTSATTPAAAGPTSPAAESGRSR
ncbi:hypothetical protein ACFS5L_02355 [Streptomyces phyllanthi]|uniref:Uncharacterized protein n=1 Tax=Streptomyces phyllanthi TaxID=1803180 RepID=A0A5N8VWQ1_9ACTN|nr:hypothetical protein [Streptomyces phyllanthi]MPY38494.1 hypothetical protein [Streptomyces phyllanthi]